MKNWKEIKKEAITLPTAFGKITFLEWSKNGQLLCVGTSYGYLYGFITHLPRLYSFYPSNRLAILTTFTKITINYLEEEKVEPVSTINMEVEPSFL